MQESGKLSHMCIKNIIAQAYMYTGREKWQAA
jgi:hypothetical protein